MRRLTIIAAMLVLLTVLAAPLVLARQQNDVGFGEPKVGDNSLSPNATGVPSPDIDAASVGAPSPDVHTGFLQYWYCPALADGFSLSHCLSFHSSPLVLDGAHLP